MRTLAFAFCFVLLVVSCQVLAQNKIDINTIKVTILDQFKCGEMTCLVMLGVEDGNIYLVQRDKKGVKTVVNKGVVIYERDSV